MSTSSDARRRILVIANATAASTAVANEVRWRARGGTTDVLVVAPLTPPPAGARPAGWDPEDVRVEAKARLQVALAALAQAGLNATGEVGDADPLVALDEAIGRFKPDEVIIATHPPGRSQWLAQNVVQRARDRHRLPTTHLAVDLEQERWDSEGGAVQPPTLLDDPSEGP
jgi:GABA permease